MTDSGVRTILNVNDDEASLYAYSRVLTRAGYRIIEARTGKDALRAAVREQPALICSTCDCRTFLAPRFVVFSNPILPRRE